LILFDSNVLIHYVKGIEPLTSRVRAASPRDVAIPSIVAYELEYGTLKGGNSRRRRVLGQVLAALREIPFDGRAARAAAEIRMSLEQAGQLIGALDLLIAGIAVSRSATLITNNVRDFGRIRSLDVQDWSH